ncbi:HPt (histidine-containing phosphotransfer) domain-containing protein [Rhizobium sp. BK650]|uniref:Hpt domain-containing protein n=1 Tax=Rhizobium sp. BK650 TaxID=2586990 RepID=UPI001622EBCD|nr:Hpt domain-containing protein [Rhizobium sp. BK650]MBB3657011.1 HPt (histidine-containing phosphotransfer) domain-containing protein [Rhizobium sp. BK650]
MAAVSVAFETPDNSKGPSPSKVRPIDLVHLARQTMGDKAVEIEVLQMFARQARACLQEIASGETMKVGAAAHRLKGAASAVGAFRVSQSAEAVEKDNGDIAAMAALGAAVVDAENFILKLCRG